MVKKLFLFIAMVVMLIPMSARADLFDISITINPGQIDEDTYTQSFTSITSIIDELDTDAIEAHFSSYDENTTAAEATINFRGIPIYLSLAANSSEIVLSIPSIGVSETFTGTDRDASVDSIEDWLEEDGDEAVTDLMQALISETSTDPVAGNPSSLQSRMVDLDYLYGVHSDEVIEMNTEKMGKETFNDNTLYMMGQYSQYDLDGVDATAYVIPLAYTIRFHNTRNNISFRMPIAMIDTDGSESYSFGLGIGATFYLKNNWSLTPAAGYGAVGSIDLGSIAQITGYSLTSSYNFEIGDYTLTMGNMVGRYETIPFEYEDYKIDVDIQNTVYKNGFIFNVPTDGFIQKTSLELSVTDTRFTGSELYVDQYNEVGLSFGWAEVKNGNRVKEEIEAELAAAETAEAEAGTPKIMKKSKKKIVEEEATIDKVRLGLSYLWGEDVTGYTATLSFAF